MKKIISVAKGAEKWLLSMQKEVEHIPPTIVFPKRKEKISILLANPEFISAILELRICFNIPSIGFFDFKSSINWAKRIILNNKLRKYNLNLQKIMKRFKIGSAWKQAIEYYLIYNRKDLDHLIPKPVNIQVTIEENGEITLRLQIYKDTELSDIIKFSSEIKKNQSALGYPVNNQVNSTDVEKITYIFDKQSKKVWKISKNKPKRFKNYEQFLRHKNAYDLKQQGKSYKFIAKELKCQYSAVSVYIKRFEDAIKQNELP